MRRFLPVLIAVAVLAGSIALLAQTVGPSYCAASRTTYLACIECVEDYAASSCGVDPACREYIRQREYEACEEMNP